MPALFVMLAAAAAAAHPGGYRPGRPPVMERSGEYLAYRLCLQKTARAALDNGVIPEDLLWELHNACPVERAALVQTAGFRARMAPGDAGEKEDELVTTLTSPIIAVEIRNYMFRYATGRPLGR